MLLTRESGGGRNLLSEGGKVMSHEVVFEFGRSRPNVVHTVVADSAQLVEQRYREGIIPTMKRKPKKMTIISRYEVDFSKPIPQVA